MPKVNCYAARPGSILRAWDKSWKILDNDTLNHILILGEVDGTAQKRVRYHPGDEIFLRWVPHTTR